MACSSRGDLVRVRLLLGSAHANVAAQMSSGLTSLSLACSSGHLEIVRELLGHGAGVNSAQEGGFGLTPLMRACWSGHLEVARLLLAHHADKAAVSRFGLMAYDYTLETNAELRALVEP